MPLTKIHSKLLPQEAFQTTRNLIINSNLDVWQRGTSFISIADGDYCADRFVYGKAGGVVAQDVTRSTDVPTFSESGIISSYSLDVNTTTADTVISAGDYAYISQKIEGYRFRNVAQREFTLSFWVKSNKTGTHCVGFRNSAKNKSYVAEYTIDVADTWEKKKITVDHSSAGGTWDYTNGIGMEVVWTIAGGLTYQTTADTWATGDYFSTSNQINGIGAINDYFRIAQVQLELGNEGTDFEEREIAVEQSLCYRYYQEYTGTFYLTIRISALDFRAFHFTWIVPMRASPSVSRTETNVGSFAITTDQYAMYCTAGAVSTPASSSTLTNVKVSAEL